MKHFSLSMESIIYIYGAGSMGIKIYRILEKHKIMVKNFFDKNADKINLDANINCPIYLLENYDGNIDNKSIAIISLLNANNHDEIALELYKKGFKNIIYIPMPGKSLISNYHSNLLRIAFSNLIDEKLEKLRALPVYYLPKLKHESLIIDNSDIITVWIPVVLLFTASDDIIENYLRENKICDCVINGSNKSIFLSQIIKLFDWFEKGKTDLSQIRKEYTINGKSAMCSSDDAWFRYIEDRLELYYSFKNALNFDYAFFINSPILVKYNERGYFNIIDGHHRASFLAMNNFKEIPVRISKEDYYKWENKELYFKILNYINNYDDIIINPNFHKKINPKLQ